MSLDAQGRRVNRKMRLKHWKHVDSFVAGATPATLEESIGASLSLPRKPNPKPAIATKSTTFDSPCISVLSCILINQSQHLRQSFSSTLHTGELLTFAHQRHPLSLSSNRSVLRYYHTTTDLALETIKPTPLVSPLPARLQPSRTDRRPTAFVSPTE
jgi:hypothetical protein